MIFIIVLPAGIFPVLVDIGFACLLYKARLELDKKMIIGYCAALAAVMLIGATHLFNPSVFFSRNRHMMYLIELICYGACAYHVAMKFKDHGLTQHAIRITNMNA